jgi:hypothetical protein
MRRRGKPAGSNSVSFFPSFCVADVFERSETSSTEWCAPIDETARGLISSERIAVVGNTETRSDHRPVHGSRRPIIERLMSGTELRVSDQAAPNGEPSIICETQGAMSQQSSDAAHGHESVPQQLLQLVGYRDPKMGAHSWHRPSGNRTR